MDRWGCVDVKTAAEVELITARLWRFTPRVESSSREAGLFWLDASGLGLLYPSLVTWASCVRVDLREAGFDATVAVGFSRFGSYAAARSGEQLVFADPEEERAFVRRVPLARLGLEADLRDTLQKLGIHTVGAFLGLPFAGIRRRLGSAAEDLYRLARGETWKPLNAAPFTAPIERIAEFEHPESDLDRLLAVVADLLPDLITDLAARHEALAMLSITLVLDYGGKRHEEVSPAAQTTDGDQILALVRLRLEAVVLTSGVVELKLTAQGAKIAEHQTGLFTGTFPKRLQAAERGLAKVRAQMGDSRVVRALLAKGHLPEASFLWEPLRTLGAPQPSCIALRPLVRRFYSPPVPLPPRSAQEPDGWLVAGLADGPVEEVIGPHFVSGGWWTRETARAYYFVRTRSGRLLWIYHDQGRRRWFLHGEAQ